MADRNNHSFPKASNRTGAMPDHGAGSVPTHMTGPIPAQEPHLKDYLQVIFIHRWILISVFFVVLCGVTVYVYTRTPIYMATAQLLIEPSNPNLIQFDSVYDPTRGEGDFNRRNFLETQYQLVVCRPLIERTFKRFRFGEKEELRDQKNPLAAFTRCFSVTPIKNTRLVRVAFEWKDPELAAKVIDFHVNAYLSDYKKRRQGVSEDGLSALTNKAEDLKPKVEEKAMALQDFSVKNNMVSFDKTQDIVVERLKAINANLTQVENARIETETKYRDILATVKADRALEEIPEIIESSTIRDLKLEYIRAKQECQDLGNRFGENHPEVMAATAKLTSISDKLKGEVEHVLNSAEAEYNRRLTQEKELKIALAGQEQKVMEFNEKAMEYTILKEAYQDLNNTYRAVTKRMEEIEIGIAAGNKEDNIFIIAKPKVPARPFKPRKLLSMALAAMVGFLLGVGLCFFVEYLDTTIKTREDVEKLLQVPVMGYVPPIDTFLTEEGEEKTVEFTALDKPHSSVAEAFSSIRTALTFSDAGRGLKTMLMTSSIPSEGKTLVSINLALALAKTGKRVLLVDGDMRKPRLTKILNPATRHGLSSLLINAPDVTLETAVLDMGIENLFALPSGPIPPNPSELLGSDRLGELMEEMGNHYDHIIFDTPPVVHATDAAVLCQWVQGAVLVVRAFSTQRDLVLRARDIIHGARGKLVGTILNSVDMPDAGQYGYGGYYYYGNYYGDGASKNKVGKTKIEAPQGNGREKERVS